MQPYTTISAPVTAEFVERRSRFIGAIAPVHTREQAEAFIAQIRRQHKDATHNVPAYILHDTGVLHCSDDGEPQGTAGTPALEVLKREELSDVCVVVTRYFGGVLLGAGGLVRAYAHACKLAVDAAQRMLCAPCERLTLDFAYPLLGKVNHILPDFTTAQPQTEYGQQVTMQLLVREEDAQRLRAQLTELSGGSIRLRSGGVQWELLPTEQRF